LRRLLVGEGRKVLRADRTRIGPSSEPKTGLKISLEERSGNPHADILKRATAHGEEKKNETLRKRRNET